VIELQKNLYYLRIYACNYTLKQRIITFPFVYVMQKELHCPRKSNIIQKIISGAENQCIENF